MINEILLRIHKKIILVSMIENITALMGRKTNHDIVEMSCD